MKRDITLEFEYPHAPEKVWRALTDAKLLATWLMDNDFQAVVGHRFTFRTKPAPGFDGIIHCEVLEAVRPTKLSYTWVAGGQSTILTFLLDPIGANRTRLRLKHEGFQGPRGFVVSLILGAGWRKKLLRTRLPNLLDTL